MNACHRRSRDPGGLRLLSLCTLLGFAICAGAVAGPIDFALADYNAAIAARNLKWKIKYEVTLDPPETFRIEPYAYGGAHVSGGDLRGLMYAMLEAADEIRSGGRVKQSRGAPATAIRAIRRFSRDGDADWPRYFEMLARDRLNRFTFVLTEPPADLDGTIEKLRAISRSAADFAVDFTLGLWYEPDESLAKIVAACPMIRAIQIRTTAHDAERYRAFVFKPLRSAGRRVALDPDPELLPVAREQGVAVRSDLATLSWPPDFEIEAPPDFAAHTEFYWLWGRLGYDPKSKPEHGENEQEFRAAAQLIADLAAAAAPANDWIASPPEAAANRAKNIASAKITPLDLANSMTLAAAQLASSNVTDFRLLAKMANAQAAKLRETMREASQAVGLDGAGSLPAESHVEPHPESQVGPRAASPGSSLTKSPKSLPARPQFVHVPVHLVPADQPINLTLQISPLKEARTVRLYYRVIGAPAATVVEKPAAASVAFTIPPTSSDFTYYFEILNRTGGWFEPDPASSTPFYIVRIQPKQP